MAQVFLAQAAQRVGMSDDVGMAIDHDGEYTPPLTHQPGKA